MSKVGALQLIQLQEENDFCLTFFFLFLLKIVIILEKEEKEKAFEDTLLPSNKHSGNEEPCCSDWTNIH